MKTEGLPKLGIIVPCYNEEEVLADSARELEGIMSGMIERGELNSNSFIAFVDDGSKDKTWNLIADFTKTGAMFRGLKLSRNSGHQKALLAGLTNFKDEADCLITIDADLQDDIRAIPEMIKQFRDGNEIVYGVRKKRKKDSLMKRLTALWYYRILKRMGVEIVYNHADFRLTSRRVINELLKYEEVNLFLRGIFPLIGFPTAEVHYDRLDRKAGKTKYPLHKMLAFAWEGVTSFSVRPLRIVTVLGFLIFFVSLVLEGYAIASYFWFGVIKGWASTVVPIYMMGGIQLLSIGIIGEYLGKIYKEVKRRPRFAIEQKLGSEATVKEQADEQSEAISSEE